MARPAAANYKTAVENFQKGTIDYTGTTVQLAAAEAASQFGEPGDTYTEYNDGVTPKKVASIRLSVGTAWISY